MIKKLFPVVFPKSILLFLLPELCCSLFYTNESHASGDFSAPFRVEQPERVRNSFWPPIASLLLPGFDQIWEEQYESAIVHAGTALVGLKLMRQGRQDSTRADVDDWRTAESKFVFGQAAYKTAMGLSSYQSFISAANTRKSVGEYLFLPEQMETPWQLAVAPFKFSYLERPTTWVPLAALLAVGAAAVSFSNTEHWETPAFDYWTISAGASYGAGVGEEAVFRGWFLPVSQEGLRSEWGANALTSLGFAAAHISKQNRWPWPQFLMGYYLGFVTQKNNWSLGESIFIHTWWDVIAILMDFGIERNETKNHIVNFQIPISF